MRDTQTQITRHTRMQITRNTQTQITRHTQTQITRHTRNVSRSRHGLVMRYVTRFKNELPKRI